MDKFIVTLLFGLLVPTIFLFYYSEARPHKSSPSEDSGIGIGVGWANASGILGGSTGTLTLTAVSSSHATISFGPDGNLIITSGGEGMGNATGSVQDPSIASLDLHGDGGGSGTSLLTPDQN